MIWRWIVNGPRQERRRRSFNHSRSSCCTTLLIRWNCDGDDEESENKPPAWRDCSFHARNVRTPVESDSKMKGDDATKTNESWNKATSSATPSSRVSGRFTSPRRHRRRPSYERLPQFVNDSKTRNGAREIPWLRLAMFPEGRRPSPLLQSFSPCTSHWLGGGGVAVFK